MRTLFAVGAFLGICLALAAQTASQSTPTQAPALVGTATNGPTTIRAHSCEIHLKSGIGVYREDVRVDNPQMTLACELLTVEAPKLEAGKFNRATADTNVVIDWTDEQGLKNHATADKAVYTYALTNIGVLPEIHWQTNALVVLTGNPVVTNAQRTFAGDPLVWDRVTGVISSTNFYESKFFQTESNKNHSLFDTTAPKPRQPKPEK
jgi:lipopolysaccharide export system protein LptA